MLYRLQEGSGSSGGGKIFYQPDDADDFDEEDPDDDLDIWMTTGSRVNDYGISFLKGKKTVVPPQVDRSHF